MFLTTEVTEVHFHAEIKHHMIQNICWMDAFWRKKNPIYIDINVMSIWHQLNAYNTTLIWRQLNVKHVGPYTYIINFSMDEPNIFTK